MNFVTLSDFSLNNKEKLQYEIIEFLKWTLKFNIPRNLVLTKDEYDKTFLLSGLILHMDTVLVVDYENNIAKIIKNRYNLLK